MFVCLPLAVFFFFFFSLELMTENHNTTMFGARRGRRVKAEKEGHFSLWWNGHKTSLSSYSSSSSSPSLRSTRFRRLVTYAPDGGTVLSLMRCCFGPGAERERGKDMYLFDVTQRLKQTITRRPSRAVLFFCPMRDGMPGVRQNTEMNPSVLNRKRKESDSSS